MRHCYVIIVAAIAIIIFAIIYHTTLRDSSNESFNSGNVSEAISQMYDEINTNVDEFNKTTQEVNNKIGNAFGEVHDKISELERRNITSKNEVTNKLMDYDNKISNMKNEFLTKDNSSKFALVSTVNDRLLNHTNYANDVYLSKTDASNQYVTNTVLGDVMTKNQINMDKQDKRLTDISNRTSELNTKMIDDYASKSWSQGEFATDRDMRFVKDVQNNILTNYAKKNDLANHLMTTTESIKQIEGGMSDLQAYSMNTFATNESVNNKLSQDYTPLDLHNKVSRTVNNTLVTLNEALLKTIKNDGNTAAYAKISLFQDTIDDAREDIDDMKTRVNGITENSIERNELILGKFRLSGVETGNNIKVFNKDGTQLSGGMTMQNLETTNLDAKGRIKLGGMVQLGQPNEPVFVNGFADVKLSKGTMTLGDVDAHHKINGNLDVGNIVTQTIQIGNNKLSPDYLDKMDEKIKIIENRIQQIENSQSII